MAYHTVLLYVALMLSTEIKAKPTTKDDANDLSDIKTIAKIEINITTADDFYVHNANQKHTDNNVKKESIIIDKTKLIYQNKENHQYVETKVHEKKKCEANNITYEEPRFIETNKLDSIYLNNIYSSVTTNLIEENVSIDSIEVDGMNLYDVVGNGCGGANICPNMREHWKSDKTVTIGFIGAYRRSQVSISFLYSSIEEEKFFVQNLFCACSSVLVSC